MSSKSLGVQWLPRDTVLERHPVQKLHGDERLPVLLADVVDRADVGMAESRRRTHLAAKPFQSLRVMRHLSGQELQSHEAAEASVFGLVHDTHPPAAQLLNDAVVGNGLADHGKKSPSKPRWRWMLVGIDLLALLCRGSNLRSSCAPHRESLMRRHWQCPNSGDSSSLGKCSGLFEARKDCYAIWRSRQSHTQARIRCLDLSMARAWSQREVRLPP